MCCIVRLTNLFIIDEGLINRELGIGELFQETFRADWSLLSDRLSRLVSWFNIGSFLKTKIGFGRFLKFSSGSSYGGTTTIIAGPPGKLISLCSCSVTCINCVLLYVYR